MDSIAIRTIVSGILTFKPTIEFYTQEDPKTVVRAAIDFNPKIVYYLESYSLTGNSATKRYKLKVKYIHPETKIGDIHLVQSVEECLQLMCRAVGNHHRTLAVVAPKTLCLTQTCKAFADKHGPFYSNLVSLDSSHYDFSGAYMAIEYEFTYRIGQVKLNMMEQEVEAEVARIAKLLFLPGMPPEAKVYLVHNYLASTVVYRKKRDNSLASSYTQSAYGALIKHECVCQGYAEAFKRIMDYAGIYCDVVAGEIVGSSESHAWNIISFGKTNTFYHIDVTWDDEGERSKYEYFCKPDSFFTGKRIWDRSINQVCTGKAAILNTARSYLRKNKQLLLDRGIDAKVLDC